MILKIKKQEDKIFVSFANESIMVSKDSTEWNDKGINNFLIQLASKTPDEDKIELEFDNKNNEEVYKHIVFLFKTFINTYNESLIND